MPSRIPEAVEDTGSEAALAELQAFADPRRPVPGHRGYARRASRCHRRRGTRERAHTSCGGRGSHRDNARPPRRTCNVFRRMDDADPRSASNERRAASRAEHLRGERTGSLASSHKRRRMRWMWTSTVRSPLSLAGSSHTSSSNRSRVMAWPTLFASAASSLNFQARDRAAAERSSTHLRGYRQQSTDAAFAAPPVGASRYASSSVRSTL